MSAEALSAQTNIKEVSFPYNLTKLAIIAISWGCLLKFSAAEIEVFVQNVFIFGLGYIYELIGICAFNNEDKAVKVIFALEFFYLFIILLIFIDIFYFKDGILHLDLTIIKIDTRISSDLFILSSIIWPLSSFFMFSYERRKKC